MKINQNQKHEAKVENFFEASLDKIDLEIGNNTNILAKAITITTRSLYSNKIAAVIRELSTNAYDSHVAAGKKDVPFEVYLPSHQLMFFVVKDSGIGMSHEDVKRYFTLFESDKINSNDSVGAFGLGSKCPFCYTNKYYLEATKDGIKRSYVAEDGEIPSLRLISEEEDQGPNGVKISIPVNPKDIFQWAEEAYNIYKRFDTVPIVKIVDYGAVIKTKEISKIEYAIWDEESQVGITAEKVERPWSIQNSYAIMGNVAYPIDHSLLNRRLGIDLRFNIGDLDIVPSREQLSYNGSTKQAILQRLEQFDKFLSEHYQKEIRKIPSMWERMKFVTSDKILNIDILNKVNKELYDNNLVWNAEKLHLNIRNTIPAKHNAQMMSLYRGRVRKRQIGLIGNMISVRPKEIDVICVSDVPRPVRYRLEHWMLCNNKESVLWINFDKTMTEEDREKSIQLVIKAFGNPSIMRYSSLPKVVKPKTIIKNETRTPRKKRNEEHYDILVNKDEWRKTKKFQRKGTLDLDEIEKEFTEDSVVYAHLVDDIDADLYGLKRALNSCGETINKVYGFNEKIVSKIRENPRFVNIRVYAKQKIEKEHEEYKELLEKNQKNRSIYSIIGYKTEEIANLATKHLDEKSYFREKVISSKMSIDDLAKFHAYSFIYQATQTSVPSSKTTFSASDLLDKYPLLKHVKLSHLEEPLILEMVKYIKAVDNEEVSDATNQISTNSSETEK